MLKILGVALAIVGLLAWSAVGRAALSDGRAADPVAASTSLRLARGGGSGGGHAAHTTSYSRQKMEEKAEAKREHDAVSQAKSNASGDESEDAADAGDADKDEAEGLRPLHHAH